ncbi:MAG: DUF1801 domain-containing protein [Saprospiraceae bacterium]|nr:DUF1801 domain-containing protein [Saprospiraceae bacterium]
MIGKLEQFYLDAPEPNQGCFLALRQLILSLDSRLSETMKYGIPCFCLGQKPFCYLWSDKKTNEPYILIVDGHRMAHARLETGDRKRMKIFRVNPAEDLPLNAILEVLDEALALSG